MAFKIGFAVVCSSIIGFLYLGSSNQVTQLAFGETPSHQEWNVLLKKHVKENGDVNYRGFQKDMSQLDEYLTLLQTKSPAENWSKNEKLAYYINLYNAGTVKLIVDNYPTKSIKNISSPWDKKIVAIGDDTFSLGHIEHKILRKMNEPRIHFAINCASYSCPKLLNKAFLAATMDAQLETATRDFIGDATRNKITAEKVQLSEIFKWFKSDFTADGSLLDFINKYSTTKIASDVKIKYTAYNWSLNEAK